MYLKVLKWADSQEVMGKDGWFFIQSGDSDYDILGSSAYAKIIDIEEEFLEIQIKRIVNEIKKGITDEISNSSKNRK
ncbi:MAG: hypothetical protein H8E98_02625 [Bacteroidetes bacterium]|nr:hypothetical protein [Bacteroidota bacterium]